MLQRNCMSIDVGIHSILRLVAIVWVGVAASPSVAEDWGAYALIPASAPALVLEAVDSGTTEGTLLSIGKPAPSPNQKWVITAKGNDFYSIKPSYNSNLVLAVAKGGVETGTAVVLEIESGQPWQEWALKKNPNGSYCLSPRHAPEKNLDHLSGDPNPGAKIDLWNSSPADPHLQWIIKPLAGSVAAVAVSTPGTPASAYVPPEIKAEEIRKGELKSFAFSSSTIYPGTVRQVTVFIPAQYDGTKPACVYVRTDGFKPEEQPLLETLIATKEMPVTIGVFVTPGTLPATVKETVGRRNRCFEYDGVSDNNVRFLVDEILPEVSKQFDLKLSTDGNDRCIAGISSGGIAAFNAAWHRPEAFSRVYANSGSFVAFRGGHEFPTLVRKFEAKPIRAFLTTGTHDMENCAGDWFLLDQEMDKALRFSGYDFSFRIIDGGHGAGFYEHYREAMAYLWRDWPKPVKAGPSAPRVRDIILPDEPWQLVADDRHDARGAAVNASGEVFFVDTADDKIYRIDVEGHVKEFLPDAGRANGLTVAADGALHAVSSETGKIVRYDAAGKGSLVVDGIRGQSLLATPDGGLYVTSNGDKPGEGGSVWFVKDGQKQQVDAGLKFATGLAYRPDQWLLAVADGRSKWAYSYQINADGTLTNKERFFWLHVPDWEDDAGAESLCHTKEGPLLVATRWGVQACADDGPSQVILPTPDRNRVIGLCLGGPEFDTLFAFGGQKIWKRKVKVHGIGAFSPWTAGKNVPL
ncbi:MAG TPA: RICIN domain-containing protein [Pirellulales bacterium]|nr:RICIN domain-containing protein [Pirellulales bacterium]